MNWYDELSAELAAAHTALSQEEQRIVEAAARKLNELGIGEGFEFTYTHYNGVRRLYRVRQVGMQWRRLVVRSDKLRKDGEISLNGELVLNLESYVQLAQRGEE